MIQNNAIMDGQGRQNNIKIDYWTETNPTNTFRQPDIGQTRAYDNSFRYFDASFIKVRNIQLGYNLPSDLVNKLSMSSIRVYASAQNPFTFSKYQKDFGIDPELGTRPSGGAENTPTYTAGNTPPTRLIIFGINAKF